MLGLFESCLQAGSSEQLGESESFAGMWAYSAPMRNVGLAAVPTPVPFQIAFSCLWNPVRALRDRFHLDLIEGRLRHALAIVAPVETRTLFSFREKST